MIMVFILVVGSTIVMMIMMIITSTFIYMRNNGSQIHAYRFG